MSKGRPMFGVRLAPGVAAEMQAALASRNAHTNREIWVLSDWIASAIREKLRKTYASRRSQRPTKRGKAFRRALNAIGPSEAQATGE